jgi:predicted nucleic acid-binding protein
VTLIVSDTSVLIDLERAELWAPALSLAHEFVVPDLLYDQELKEYGGSDLVDLGLRIEVLTGDEVEAAHTIRRERLRLSAVDAAALSLAEQRGWMLLAGDGVMRAQALSRGIECHGTFWVFDQIEEAALMGVPELATSLQRLHAHPRCRLPIVQINQRLAKYAAGG